MMNCIVHKNTTAARRAAVLNVFYLTIPLLPYLATGDNKDIGIFLRRTSLLTLARRFAPKGLCPLHTSTLLAFAAAIRMIDRVHCSTANGRTNTHPAATTGLADYDEIIFFVADRADARPAKIRYLANLG